MKPRLLFIVGRFVIGGHATDNIPLLYHLKEKYTVKLVYGEKEADEVEPLFLLKQFPGLDTVKLPVLRRRVNPFADFITLIRVCRIVRHFKPDIVHTHGAKAGFTGRLAAWLCSTYIIVHTFHGNLFHSYFNPVITRVVISLEKILATITDAAIALSPSQKDEIVEKYKVYPHQKAFIIPLGLFEPHSSTLYEKNFRQRYGLNEEDVAIALIGRLVQVKNPTDFLKVLNEVAAMGYNTIKWFVIGDGQERMEMIQYLKEHNIPFSLPEKPHKQAQVFFTSWIADVYEVIYELDVITLTSNNEGTPVSLIEAQLCGKPVVAYDVGGVKDTFVDNVSGYLVEKGNITDFAEKLVTLIDDKALRQSMGEKGRAYASEKFSKLNEVKRIDELYTNLLDKKRKKVR